MDEETDGTNLALKSWAEEMEDEDVRPEKMAVDLSWIDENDKSELSYGELDFDPFMYDTRTNMQRNPGVVNATEQAQAQENQEKAKDTWVQVARRNLRGSNPQNLQNPPPAPPAKDKGKDARTTGHSAPAEKILEVINALEYRIFHVTFSHPIDPVISLHSQRMFSCIAALPQALWKLNCLEVKWTKNGAISLCFPVATRDNTLKFHQMNILRTLNHGDADAVFTQQLKWSRVTIYNIKSSSSTASILRSPQDGLM